jgi:hypothetical protein
MKKRMLLLVVVLWSWGWWGPSALSNAQTAGDATEGKPARSQDAPPKPVLGDRDDIAFQNQRYLKVKNDTASTLSVSLQYRTLVKDAFTWLPAVPKEGADALSLEIQAGEEMQVKVGDEPLAASRVRIWAMSETDKWLTYKTRDLWLVPEKNDEGEHVYAAEAPETYVFTFAARKGDTDVSDLPSGSTYPGEDPGTLMDDLVPPGEPLPDGSVMPVIRDLSVLPVYVSGKNAVIRVKNRGHTSDNLGRNLYVKPMLPGALPTDLGPIGPLFHKSVRAFPVVGLSPGDWVAYVSPGDDPPFDANDVRQFTVTSAAFTDLRVLPVAVSGGMATVKVKNVGSMDYPGGRKVRLVKLVPGAVPMDVGPIGALGVNAVQAYPALALAPGKYRAFISPGDPPPYASNDAWIFGVAAASFADLKVLPVAVMAGNVHVKVKNVGTAVAPAGRHLWVVKLTPGAIPVDKGTVGILPPGVTKAFAVFPLPPGKYKAYISPSDPPPFAGNDFDNFTVGAAPFVDLAVLSVTVSGGQVHVKVKNVGTAPAPAGWHLEVVKLVPGSVPVDHGAIGALAPGATKTFAAFALPPGNYKAYISPGDPPPHAGNDFKSFAVAAPGGPDLAVSALTKVGNKVTAKVTNLGPGPYTPGTRQWHLERWNGMAWVAISSGNVPGMVAGAHITVQGGFTGAGTYRIRITGADSNMANNQMSKAL